jgi:antitoxin HigA-1
MARVTTHPGEMLYHEFMVPYAMTGRALAKRIGVPANRITDLVRSRRGMTADTAIRLETLFGMPAYVWMRLQEQHDLSQALASGDYSGIEPIERAA